MTNGCAHNNVNDNPALLMAPCPDCASLIDMPVWRKLHPPPEPPKSWVRQRAEATGQPEFCAGLLRETVEECCRWLASQKAWDSRTPDDLRRAMLEPKP